MQSYLVMGYISRKGDCGDFPRLPRSNTPWWHTMCSVNKSYKIALQLFSPI